MNRFKTALLFGLLLAGVACGYSHSMTPVTAGTIPTVSQLNPSSDNAGNGAFMLTVNGTNFNSNAIINWNNVPQTTTFVTGGQLTAMIPSSDIANSGTATVTVTNPGKPSGPYGGGTQSETSNSMMFTIN